MRGARPRPVAARADPETRNSMKKLMLVLAVLCAGLVAQAAPDQDLAAWQRQAQSVTIVRDDWGIAHVHGKSDADAVFGMIYAQAEDDFNRIETNFLNSMGRLAEAEGEGEIYRDLRMKIFIDPADLQAQYAAAPPWLKALMNAWADGLNYYLHTHPSVKPRVLTKFEPWMALSFSEGSIGGDIEKVGLGPLQALYGKAPAPPATPGGEGLEAEPSGSNGFAFAPSITASKHAMLWINPHTSFFFRSELQMTSDEGLNAYGAATWGQFFIYQGFNERAGWMHTTSSVDDIDEYLETVIKKDDGVYYKYGTEERRMTTRTITVPYKTAGGLATKTFTVYRTHHGPIVREAAGKWIAIRMMQEPLKALTQSYSRTKATGLKSFRATMDLHTNSSNNTIYADADGNIAYFHANFIPKRDPKFDWGRPVDGSDPATEWGALLSVEESPLVVNPANGWIQNTNNWPYSVSGPLSPKKEQFASYVDPGSENPRGIHAMRVLAARKDFTIESVIAAGYDSLMPPFEGMVPPLVQAWDALAAAAPLKAKLADQIALMRAWDFRWGAASVPTTLALFWGDDLSQRVAAEARKAGVPVFEYMEKGAIAQQRLDALAAASDKLQADFGTWKTPWGDINRFQRLSGDIVQPFSDAGPSIPVMFTSARWGSLASFGARAYRDTKKWYGTSGNSFIAVVEFGPQVRARAVSAGGESGDPRSKHFNDQAVRYATGNLREVYFYPSQLTGHTERSYHPGS
jgi:acyl-homoserine-lactone acylase